MLNYCANGQMGLWLCAVLAYSEVPQLKLIELLTSIISYNKFQDYLLIFRIDAASLEAFLTISETITWQHFEGKCVIDRGQHLCNY